MRADPKVFNSGEGYRIITVQCKFLYCMCAICSSPDVSSHIVWGSYFVDVINMFVVFVHMSIPINTIQ